MNHYEELGIPPNASTEAIRAGYKTLAKILHPDAQPDPVLKAAAERQMRRLNEIVATLADPARRAAYDASLQPGPPAAGPSHPGPVFVPLVPRVYWHDHIVRRQLLGAAFASLAVCACVWAYFAGEARVTPLPQATPSRAAAPGDPARDAANALAQDVGRRSQPGSATKAGGLAGSWLFLGTRNAGEAGDTPEIESIQFYLAEQNGALFGRYAARYRSNDEPIPDTTFSVTGRAAAPGTASLSWSAPDGSTGTVRLTLRSPDALSLDWWTNQAKRKVPVSSGSVLLSRLK